jgi:hypothetical protein
MVTWILSSYNQFWVEIQDAMPTAVTFGPDIHVTMSKLGNSRARQ